MDWDKIKTMVSTTSALITAGDIYTKLSFRSTLNENEISEFIEPLYNDLMIVKGRIEKIEINSINIDIKTRIEALKAPKFLNDNKNQLIGIENHINEIIKSYNSIKNLCIGVFNESLKLENLNYSLKAEEFENLSQVMVDYLFYTPKSEQINELYHNLISIVKPKFAVEELSWLEIDGLNKKVKISVINAMNRIMEIDKTIESPISVFIKKYFEDPETRKSMTDYQIMLQGQVRSFMEYRIFVFNEIKEITEQIKNHYNKNKPKK